MRRLFPPAPEPHDIRPTVLSVVALMLLLLPLTLFSTSLDKRTSLPIGLTGGGGERIASDGPVERLRVVRQDEGFVVKAAVRTTDIRAAAGEVELRQVIAEDLTALQRVLWRFKRMDPARTELTLVPAPRSTTAEVVRWMDATRRGPDGELYPRVVLEASP